VAGSVTAFSGAMRTASGGDDGLRTRPGASFSPARRWAMKRRHQSFTISRETPTRTDMSLCHAIGAPQDDLSSLTVVRHDGLCPHSPLQPLHFGPKMQVKDSKSAKNSSTLTFFRPAIDAFFIRLLYLQVGKCNGDTKCFVRQCHCCSVCRSRSWWAEKSLQHNRSVFSAMLYRIIQVAQLPSAIPISANTTYIAAYYTSNGQNAWDEWGMNNGVANGPLTAPASSAVGGNGVWHSNNSFPSSTYNSSNYYVDVLFAPTGRSLVLNFNPSQPSISAEAPLGSVVATVTPTWSDGSPFTGTLSFAHPIPTIKGFSRFPETI
jgi:hypothetical protein